MWQRAKGWFVQNRHEIAVAMNCLIIFQVFGSVGRVSLDWVSGKIGVANMNTPYFLSRSARSPMHPYGPRPHEKDLRGLLEYNR